MPEARRALDARQPAAYLELHIEQGPVLEALGRPTGVVLGTFGVERHVLRFTGQAAHSGSTPIPMRRDAFLAAAETALACRDIARRLSTPDSGLVCTVGTVRVEPGIVTAVPGVCEIALDQRALDPAKLAQALAEARAAAATAAADNRVEVEWRHVWRIEPRPFDPRLIALCAEAVQEVTGDAPRLPSGPLHDAVEMGRLMPAVMMFARSSNGLSHCKEEDTPGSRPRDDHRGLPAAGRQDRRRRPESGLMEYLIFERRHANGATGRIFRDDQGGGYLRHRRPGCSARHPTTTHGRTSTPSTRRERPPRDRRRPSGAAPATAAAPWRAAPRRSGRRLTRD